jgi:hypothetical protein
MTAEAQKYTRDEIEALELAPAAERENLEGWTPTLATDDDVKDAIEKAFDFRGDVTLTLKSGATVECFIFNRQAAATLADSWLQYFAAGDPAKHKLAYAEIAGIAFSGKDRAAGKHWEDWVKAYNEKKAAGEKNIGLAAEKLDE